MKKIILLLLVVLTTNSFAQNGFRGYEWGTSRDVIEQEIGLPTFAHPRGKPQYYKDSLMGYEVLVSYAYDKELVGGFYVSTSLLAGQSFDFFRKVEKALVEKYGYKENNAFLNDSELINVMSSKENYSLEFNDNVYLKFNVTTLYDPKKEYVVYVIYVKPEDYSYSKEDADKL